jgi:cell division protein FtsQ
VAERDERPVDLVIVEQEPDGASSEPAPTIIRIGAAGSAEIDDATPESLVEPPAAAAPAGTARPHGEDDRDVIAVGGAEVADGDVITIDDDDLPDAVYVEGSLDADGSGTIVFIEDDDTGDVLGPESERDLRRGIEPRMRERRVAVRRAQGRRRLKRVALVAGVVILVVGVLAVLGSPLFAVREGDVEVFGARYTDEQRLQEIIDDAVGTPVLRLDTDQVEADIEAIPWVDEASVSTDFPHGLVIDIREREAWTTYQGPDGRFRVLDRDGRVLDVLDMYPFAYVLVVGPDPVDLEAGDFAPQGYVAASELAKNLTGAMRGRVTQIEVTADGSRLAVQLEDGSTVLFGEARDLLAKLVRLEAVLTNGQDCESGQIDVSTADVTRCSVLD